MPAIMISNPHVAHTTLFPSMFVNFDREVSHNTPVAVLGTCVVAISGLRMIERSRVFTVGGVVPLPLALLGSGLFAYALFHLAWLCIAYARKRMRYRSAWNDLIDDLHSISRWGGLSKTAERSAILLAWLHFKTETEGLGMESASESENENASASEDASASDDTEDTESDTEEQGKTSSLTQDVLPDDAEDDTGTTHSETSDGVEDNTDTAQNTSDDDDDTAQEDMNEVGDKETAEVDTALSTPDDVHQQATTATEDDGNENPSGSSASDLDI